MRDTKHGWHLNSYRQPSKLQGKKYRVLLEKLAIYMKMEVFAFIFTQHFCPENSGIASRRKFGNFPQQHKAPHYRRQ
jgi:hypothetical protein